MRASDDAPAALKYRNDTERSPWHSSYQRNIRSTMSFDSAYGLSGPVGWCSSTGNVAGEPYTLHDDENTTRSTPLRCNASSSRAVPATLFAKYFSGSSID